MRHLAKSLKSHWTLYLLLAVPVIYVFVFSYIPMAGLQIAFKDLDLSKGFYGGDWVGLKHFKLFFS